MDPVVGRAVEPIDPILLYNSLSTLPCVFTGAVKGDSHDNLVTAGGRCFTVVGRADTINGANEQAYRYVSAFRFKGAWHREDIGNRFMRED